MLAISGNRVGSPAPVRTAAPTAPLGRAASLALLAAFGCVLGTHPSRATPLTYQYEIESSRYGDIGTYTNRITQEGNLVDVATELHVAVKLIGIRLFHQDAQRMEYWDKGRFVAFRSRTDDNGTLIDVTGKAQDKGFVIESPSGTVVAPPQVHPSNPWRLSVLDTNVMMSTKSGKVTGAVVTDKGRTNLTIEGRTLPANEFFVDSDKHQIVWFGADGAPVAFQTNDDGSVITFVLKGHGYFLP